RSDWRQCRGRNAFAGGRSRAPEIFPRLGKRGLRNGCRRRDLCYRTRRVRLFPGGGDAGRSASHLLEKTQTSEASGAPTEMSDGSPLTGYPERKRQSASDAREPAIESLSSRNGILRLTLGMAEESGEVSGR